MCLRFHDYGWYWYDNNSCCHDNDFPSHNYDFNNVINHCSSDDYSYDDYNPTSEYFIQSALLLYTSDNYV
jgi:hypothetical protein